MIHKWFASRCVWPNRGATATHRSLNARAAYVKNWELRQRQCTYNYASGKSQCVKTPQSSSSAVCCNQHCAGIVECSCNILELNRIVLSPNGRFWDCAAIAVSERHTHVRTDEHNSVATQPVYQFDRPQALDNVMLLNVYCTTTVDPFKSLPFPTPNKIKKNKIIRTINVVKSIHSLRLQYSKQTTETSHGILWAVRAFKCGANSSITSTTYLALGQRVCDDVTTVNSKKSRASDSAYVAAINLWQVPATVNAGFSAINVNNSCQSLSLSIQWGLLLLIGSCAICTYSGKRWASHWMSWCEMFGTLWKYT